MFVILCSIRCLLCDSCCIEDHCICMSKKAAKCKGVDVGLEYAFTVIQVN
jgi:hypothetical protein